MIEDQSCEVNMFLSVCM